MALSKLDPAFLRDITSCDDDISNEITCALEGPMKEPRTLMAIRRAIHNQYAWHRDAAMLLGAIDNLFDLNKKELTALLKNAKGTRAVIIKYLIKKKA